MPISPPFAAATPLPGFDPVDGYTLCSMNERDDDGFSTQLYFARMEGDGAPFAVDFYLDVSRFAFRPTQERFAWLVENVFPRRQGIGPWDDWDIDRQISISKMRHHQAVV